LCFYAERFTGNQPEAEDIVVDSFLKCYRRRDQFENLENIRSFLYVTVKNASLDHLAAKKRHDLSHKEWQRRLEVSGRQMLVEDAFRGLASPMSRYHPAYLQGGPFYR
jgi:RNA polymerase sigma factor (sigma-70 family)